MGFLRCELTALGDTGIHLRIGARRVSTELLLDNAGVFVAPDTLERAHAQGMKIDAFLARNDAYGFFEPLGDLVVTGPTHTNVNDFRAILVH